MTALTLPGTIPGLLRRCSPVTNEDGSARGLIYAMPGHYRAYPDWWGVNWNYLLQPCDATRLHLDLTDPTGRAHAAWWLALRECPASHVLDPAAVAWHPAPAQASFGWALHFGARAKVGEGCLTGAWWTGAGRRPIPARVLRHLVRDDPRRLPDGSRWVDAEALRLVCLHVAGVVS